MTKKGTERMVGSTREGGQHSTGWAIWGKGERKKRITIRTQKKEKERDSNFILGTFNLKVKSGCGSQGSKPGSTQRKVRLNLCEKGERI